jgi:hypothetical protein
MASANFNTEIVSSNSKEKLEYDLDKVISKDFIANKFYQYTLSGSFPDGVSIENRQMIGTYLIIPPSVGFDLSINVFNGDKKNPIEAKATTKVTIEGGGEPSFSTEITKFYEKSNFGQKKEQSAQNWSNIISQRTSSSEESVVSDR